jgi:hypothetical protein
VVLVHVYRFLYAVGRQHACAGHCELLMNIATAFALYVTIRNINRTHREGLLFAGLFFK